MAIQRIVKIDRYQGTSSQPPIRRQDGQDDIVHNCEPDPIYGLLDRNGTDFTANLTSSLDPYGAADDYLTFQFKQFIIRIRLGEILVCDNEGNNIEVIDLTVSNYEYFDTVTDPLADIDYAIIGDTIFLANKKVTVGSLSGDNYTARTRIIDFSKLIAPIVLDETGLQITPVANDIFNVLDTINNTPAGYYKFLGGDHTLGQNYERVPAPNDPDAVLDKGTMLHILEYIESDNVFHFGANQEWGQRVGGNSISNPVPTFVGQTIDCIGYLQSRIVIVSGNSISTSQQASPTSEIFSFWINDPQRTVETDPLSLDINFPEIGTPLRCGVIGFDLLIDCSQGQMVLTGGQSPITNVNGSLKKLTSYPSRGIPLASNGQLIFTADENNFIRGYNYVSYIVGTQYIGCLNEHNQKLLQATQPDDKVVIRIFATSDRLFVASDRNAVLFRFRYDGQQFSQLAIHTWDFADGNDKFIYADQFINKIRILTLDTTSQEVHFIKYYPNIEQPLPDWDFSPALDYREITQATGYVMSTNETAFTLSSKEPNDHVWLVSNFGGNTTYTQVSRYSGHTAFFKGDYRNLDCYLGFDYESKNQLTNLYVTPGNVVVKLKQIEISAFNTCNLLLSWGRKGTDPKYYNQKAFSSQSFEVSALNESVVQLLATYTAVGSGDARYTDIIISKRGPGRFTVSALSFLVDVYTPGNKFPT